MPAPKKLAKPRKKTTARPKKKSITKKRSSKPAKKAAPKSRMRLYVMESRGENMPLDERLIPGSTERAALLASTLTGNEVRGWEKGRDGEWRHVLSVFPRPVGRAHTRTFWY